MNIVIDGVERNWTIKKIAKEVGVTDIVIIHRLRCLGIKGVKPEGRILFSQQEADQMLRWNESVSTKN